MKMMELRRNNGRKTHFQGVQEHKMNNVTLGTQFNDPLIKILVVSITSVVGTEELQQEP